MAGVPASRRLRSALGGLEDAAREAFEPGEEGLVAKRRPMLSASLRPSNNLRLRSFVEEIGEARKALEHRGEAGDLVVEIMATRTDFPIWPRPSRPPFASLARPVPMGARAATLPALPQPFEGVSSAMPGGCTNGWNCRRSSSPRR